MDPEALTQLDATELAGLIRRKDVSPMECLHAHLALIERSNPSVNAVVTLNPSAEEQARKATRYLLQGGTLPPLHGVPFTVKDTFDTAGLRTTRGSLLYRDHVPTQNATAVQRLLDAGAILLGKTNTPEFAMWSETDNRVFGATKHPKDLSRTPGGSSGGEAAAIASGMSPLGLGSDLSGSIRLPAHFCGVAGLKPTHGRIPLTGHWPPVLSQFSHAGPMARSIRDLRTALAILEGGDGVDWHAQRQHFGAERTSDLSNFKIGWLGAEAFSPLADDVAEAVAAAALALRSDVRSVVKAGIPALERQDYDVLTTFLYRPGSNQYLNDNIGSRHELLHDSITARLADDWPSLQRYVDAERQVDVLRAGLMEYFADMDILLCPVAPVTAPHLNQGWVSTDGVTTVPPRAILRATVPFNLAGTPAVSVPYRLSSDSMPIGVQVVGAPNQDHVVLNVAERLHSYARDSGALAMRASLG